MLGSTEQTSGVHSEEVAGPRPKPRSSFTTGAISRKGEGTSSEPSYSVLDLWPHCEHELFH